MRSVFILTTLVVSVAACASTARTPERYRDDTAALLESKQPALVACYDRALQSDSGARGAVRIRFTVEQDTGRIKDVSVDRTQTTASAPVIECVTQTVDGLVLTPPDGREGHATFVWDFTPPPKPAPGPPAGGA